MITKEEISLCKQVAEKYKKDIEYGDWYKTKIGISLFKKVGEILPKRFNFIPLWTISDCLEFLRERGWYVYKFEQWIGSDTWQLIITNPENLVGNRNKEGRPSKTPLEACLKAVLAVLEEKPHG